MFSVEKAIGSEEGKTAKGSKYWVDNRGGEPHVDQYLSKQKISLNGPTTAVPQYKRCRRLPIDSGRELTSCSTRDLAECVVGVVDVESPISVENTIRRIRELFNYERTGLRIQ